MNTDTGGKKPYHFGNLKEALIEQGIALIHEEGIEKFSQRLPDIIILETWTSCSGKCILM